MRKHILLILCILPYSIINAQYFHGGFSLGVTGSQIDGDRYGGYTKPGISAGFFVNREASKNWTYQGEIKYIMKGASKRTSTDSPDVYRVTLHYVELPITLLFKATQKVQFEGGLASAYLIYATNNFGYGPEAPINPFNNLDFSPLIGIYYLLTENFIFNLKISYSAFAVRDFPGDYLYYRKSGQFNNVLNFALYYNIR